MVRVVAEILDVVQRLRPKKNVLAEGSVPVLCGTGKWKNLLCAVVGPLERTSFQWDQQSKFSPFRMPDNDVKIIETT